MRKSRMGAGGGLSSSSLIPLSLFSAGTLQVVEIYSFLSSTPAFAIRVDASC